MSLPLLSLLMLSGAPLHAQTPPETEPAPSLEISANLRGEYLAGEPMIVQLLAANSSASSLSMPDLSAQYDRIRFELLMPGGSTANRRSLLDVPSTQQWQIPPRGVREVTLELPASTALRAGSYQVAIHVKLNDTDEQTLPPHPFRIAAPSPTGADLTAAALVSDRGNDLIPWVHQANEGYDIYLHRSNSATPEQPLSQDFLVHLTTSAQPHLTAARATEASRRYIVWLQDERIIHYGELQGHQLRNAVKQAHVPWPKISLPARGVTTAEGHLYQPLWIPSPNGTSGELRMLTATTRGTFYRRIARFAAEPDIVQTVIDDGGAMHLVVSSGEHVDLYSIHAGTDPEYAASENLPIAGRRIATLEPGQHIHGVRFGFLNAEEGYPGGLALMLLVTNEAGRLAPQWLTLNGTLLRTGTTLPALPEGASLVDISPAGSGDVGVLIQGANGTLQYIENRMVQQLPSAQGPVALDRSPEGTPYLRRLAAPIATVKLTPNEPLPEPVIIPDAP